MYFLQKLDHKRVKATDSPLFVAMLRSQNLPMSQVGQEELERQKVLDAIDDIAFRLQSMNI